MDPATASAIASGLAQMGKAGPAISGGGPTSIKVEGMQIPGQQSAGLANLAWPIMGGLVALVWLRKQ
jgi:hypothetical protein